MKTVKTLQEAKQHFIENTYDPIKCVRTIEGQKHSKECDNFPEARSFFEDFLKD